MKTLVMWQLLILSFLLAVSLPAKSQSNVFVDDFSDATPWTQVGSYVTVASGTGNISRYAACGYDRRMYRSFVEPCSEEEYTLDDEYWTAKIQFTPTLISSAGVAHMIMNFITGPGDPYSSSSATFIGVICTGPLGQPAAQAFYIDHRIGSATHSLSSSCISISANTTYYLRFTRQDDYLILESCNSSYTTTYTTVRDTITGAIENLAYMQFGTISNAGTTRYLEGTLDNFSIDGLENTSYDEWFDYMNSDIWLWNTTNIVIPTDPSNVNYSKLFFNNVADGTDQRMYSSLYNLDYGSLDDDDWVANFDFRPTAVGIMGGPGHMLLAFTSSTNDPFASSLPDQDVIAVTWVSNPLSSNPSTFELRIRAKNGTGAYTLSSPIILSVLNTTYYMTLTRSGNTSLNLTVYDDECRTGTPIGSVSLSVTNNTISGLSIIQHGAITTGSSYRRLTATIDNTFITNGSSKSSVLAIPSSTTIEEESNIDPVIIPNPNSGTFQISFGTKDQTDGVNIEIFDIWGRKVYERVNCKKSSESINLGNFEKGVYIVKYTRKSGISSDRILIN